MNLHVNLDHYHKKTFSLATLGWVSPGAATEGVIPIFSSKKTDDLFLLITATFIDFTSGITP